MPNAPYLWCPIMKLIFDSKKSIAEVKNLIKKRYHTTFNGLSRPIWWSLDVMALLRYFDPSQLIVALLVRSRDNKNNLKRLMFECTSAFDPENTPSPSCEKFFSTRMCYLYTFCSINVSFEESRIKKYSSFKSSTCLWSHQSTALPNSN